MKIRFSKLDLPKDGSLVVFALKDKTLSASAAAADKALDGAVSRAMAASRFKGGGGDSLVLPSPGGGRWDRVVVLGLGKAAEFDGLAAQNAGGRAVAALNGAGAKSAVLLLDPVEGGKIGGAEAAARAGFGARLRSYRFDRYRTKEKAEQKPTLSGLTVGGPDAAAARKAFKPLDRLADGVFLTRDLVSEPPNVMYPETLAAQGEALRELGVEVEVLGEDAMRDLGMGSLLGVGQGSVRESKLLVMQWKGGGEKDQPVAFVGKGVTFDTGGISIKPAAGMEDMKWDMGGSGVVIGLMKALAGRKAKCNAVGVAGLVENMPSGAAQRPGDIVTSMSGQTVEVLNTDAEGRLVLADALWYTQDRFKPKFMIDLATLTGAIIIALGNENCGLFANNDELADRIAAAGKAAGEPAWRMPLGDAYDKLLTSDAADVKNIGGRGAGSITAAQFLQRFVNDVPWAHLDIAGVTWSKKDRPTVPKGGTGFGVQLLDRLVAEHYEG
ncbi:MAG: leucyl aminopeptidase [Rhodospirillaceae bacterium]|nr:leucyl aminopeptidase [Rhodospirillaceae bacterium]MYK12854.1 leucyl aminopeptidase [Rhodospirillaceae bacterium]MYK57142.1 leucyl aminopeptidase [Rhodospirillaceae bacterium]